MIIIKPFPIWNCFILCQNLFVFWIYLYWKLLMIELFQFQRAFFCFFKSFSHGHELDKKVRRRRPKVPPSTWSRSSSSFRTILLVPTYVLLIYNFNSTSCTDINVVPNMMLWLVLVTDWMGTPLSSLVIYKQLQY